MPDYDLSRLSNRSFEHLVQALAARVLGPGIVVFGDGPDGGREATFERKIPYPSTVDSWNGYGVVQAKCRQRSRETQQDGSWAVAQLKEELKKYTDPESKLRKPDYFIFATNVVLTPVLDRGSKDQAVAALEEFKSQSPLKDYAIWDYDQIRTFLDAYEDVRKAYTAFITSGDVLAEIISKLNPSPTDMYETLVRFLERELLSDECVKLEQAGHSVDDRIPLASVFVDLPTLDDSAGLRAHILEDADVNIAFPHPPVHEGEGFIKEILAVSSELLDPTSMGTSVISNSLDPAVPRGSRGRFVLIGGPGQGKTTLTQFICQIFRASVISGKPENTLSLEIRSALGTIQHHCDIEGMNHTVVPRFPFKLVLNDFATALSNSSTSQVNSVLGYLSRQIQNRTDSDISADDLRRFLAAHPSVFIFDGLDEVPASSNRDQVLDAIRDFWIDASNANADILSIATSRPQGYNEDFSPLYYQHRELAELSHQLGWHYAQRLAEVRFRTDEDRKQKVLSRLDRAFREVSTARLMRSPLQVTIMAALVDRVGQPPQARWSLFNQYYEVIYDREVERSIPASIILREFQPDIKAIHNQVGLILQIDSERTGRTDAKLSRDRFVALVEARLETEEHPGDRLHTLAQQIVEAASHRLVFLVEVEEEQVGFEIRSLQEFMAAECLMDGTEQSIKDRLDEIAPIPFWRNVFLFAAGKCFAQRQELREPVRDICAELNEVDGDKIAGTYLVGSDLAIALMEEGSSRNQPRFENLLARVAIRALDTANPDLHIQLADVYGPQLEGIYQEAIKLRLTSTSKVQVFGAWNCLLRLVAAEVPWAVQLATEVWPTSDEDQVGILLSVHEPTKNPWATHKLLQLIPTTPTTTFADVLQPESRRRWLEGHDAGPQVDTAVSVIQSGFSHLGLVNVLETGVSYGSIGSLTANENVNLPRLRHIQGWHPSWDVYKCAGEFMEAPSKESLANALESLASFFYAEEGMITIFQRPSNLPWPILACLSTCTNGQELLYLADKAVRGELGDVDDWLAAEGRWFDKGITRDDLLSMSDDRLPFDARIAETGFPINISVLAAIFGPPRYRDKMQEALDIFDNLPSGKARSLVAMTINWLFFVHSIGEFSDEASTSSDIDFEKLKSIYQEVPPGSFIPLHMIVNLIGDSIQDVAEFFQAFEGKNFGLHWEGPSRNRERESVAILIGAYMRLDENALLLPILGVVAENGRLSGQYVDVKVPKSQETSEEKLAALIINLCQESWQSDSYEKLIASAQDVGGSSTNVFNRVVNTLENCKPAGENVDEFVVALRDLIPPDDFGAHQRYVNLLEDVLRRRTSQFGDTREAQRFALPAGVFEVLKT